MIGLVLDMALGRGGGGCFACIFALGAAFLLCRCCRCRLRSLGCIRVLYRFLRIDTFPDVKLSVVISEVSFTGDCSETFVRITAGDEVHETQHSTDGNYRESCELYVAQGTEVILVELCDSWGYTKATLPLDPIADLRLDSQDCGFEKQTVAMDDVEGSEDVTRARIQMAFYGESFADDTRFAHILEHVQEEDRVLVEQQLLMTYKANYGSLDPESGGPTEFELATKTCSGPVKIYGGWGSTREVYIAVLGPPRSADWVLGVWPDQESFEKGRDAQEKINLLRVLSVQAEPTRKDVFVVNFMVTRTQKQRLVMERIDRSRDVWVDMIKVVVNYVHERRARRQRRQAHHAR